MCNNISIPTPLYFALRCPSKGKNVRVHCFKRRRRLTREARGKGMVGERRRVEIKNLKLYKENQSIMRANERLRKKALLLHQENQELLFQLQNKYSVPQTDFAHTHSHSSI
ncbi:hypothetical protein HS088_TW08G00927 [Tripterygium wilfordii]|uniref:Uncharacterized protein n=1 Tax=Tripterygium wilfordii TaxID=458696 RepID=A0A7J7DE24_TRIWF|nr:protein LITTLE ZIPPER 2-like isoform X2 [Tripterygium wilfordii]KAF5744326.1 hypothetical protein HS088_TW08G00927 [Tripterygium wilfordii]